MLRPILCGVMAAGLMLALSSTRSVHADVLFYSGDVNSSSGNGLSNLDDASAASTAQGITYQNFIVPVGKTWTITALYSNDVTNISSITSADWSIRSAMSSGNGGTVVASANGASASTSTTGRSLVVGGNSTPEYTVSVSGLDIVLSAGTYWLNVTPVSSSSSQTIFSYNTNTPGTNSVGTDNSGQEFWYAPQTNSANNYVNANNAVDSNGNSLSSGHTFDLFSDGVVGTSASSAVPEPSTWLLSGLGALGLAFGGGVSYLRRLRSCPSLPVTA